MAALSSGGVTLITSSKNGSAPYGMLTIAGNTTLTFTHNLGIKNGFGKGAWKVRVLDENGADLSTPGLVGGAIRIAQVPNVDGLTNDITVRNDTPDDFQCVIEITWEVHSSQVQLIEGTPAKPGITLPSPYPVINPTFYP